MPQSLYALMNVAQLSNWPAAKVLARLGLAGVGLDLRAVTKAELVRGVGAWPALVEQWRGRGLSVVMARVGMDVRDPLAPEALDPVIDSLRDPGAGAGAGAILDVVLYSRSAHDAASSPRADAPAAKLIRELADLAQAAGMKTALSPQTGQWLADIKHAVRLAVRINHPQVGVSLNLHDAAARGAETLNEELSLAAGKLWNVTMDGVGDEPHAALVARLLGRMGYAGPVGIDVTGNAGFGPEQLRGFIKRWREGR